VSCAQRTSSSICGIRETRTRRSHKLSIFFECHPAVVAKNISFAVGIRTNLGAAKINN
jgi:hypothetical protein